MAKKIIHLPSCHSTNDIAAEIASQVEEGTVVICDIQTQGRGQRGNKWLAAPHQNLTFSIVLKPHFLQPMQQFFLNIAIALGIREALAQGVAERQALKVKWSNDIYYQQSKIGGILIENTIEGHHLKHAIVGVGLNVNQPEFPLAQAGSLLTISQRQWDLGDTFDWLMQHIDRRYQQLRRQEWAALQQDYLLALYWFKEEHLFADASQNLFRGTIVGVKESGQLIVEETISKEKRYFDFKEITFIS